MDNFGRYFRRDESGQNYERIEAKLEPIMLALSALFVVVFIIPTITDVSDESEAWLSIAGWVVWGLFVIEYVWLLALSPVRTAWVTSHKLDLMIIVLPFLRPIRFVRVVRMATTTTAIGRALVSLRRIGTRPGFQPFFGLLALFMLLSAGLVLVFEHEQPGASIDNISTALWWAFVTCTTVGYGDHFPVTTGGRVVAVSLMIVGIAGLSLLTASVAALFVDQDEEEGTADLKARLIRIEDLLVSMTAITTAATPSAAAISLIDTELDLIDPLSSDTQQASASNTDSLTSTNGEVVLD